MSDDLFLTISPSANRRHCEIFFQSGDFAFPQRSWIDFADITDGWQEKLSDLDRHGACELWFVKGPYHVAIARHDAFYQFDFMTWYDRGDSADVSLLLPPERSISNIKRSIADWKSRARLN